MNLLYNNKDSSQKTNYTYIAKFSKENPIFRRISLLKRFLTSRKLFKIANPAPSYKYKLITLDVNNFTSRPSNFIISSNTRFDEEEEGEVKPPSNMKLNVLHASRAYTLYMHNEGSLDGPIEMARN